MSSALQPDRFPEIGIHNPHVRLGPVERRQFFRSEPDQAVVLVEGNQRIWRDSTKKRVEWRLTSQCKFRPMILQLGCEASGRILEHFFPVPIQIFGIRIQLAFGRKFQVCTMQRINAIGRYRVATEHDPMVAWQYGEYTKVKKFMVERAQCQPVCLDVGTVGLNPLDMGGFKTDALPAKPHVMSAHATAVFVSQQDFFPERRIPASGLVLSDQYLIRIDIPKSRRLKDILSD